VCFGHFTSIVLFCIDGATRSPFFRFNPLLGKGFGKTAIVASETNTREADPVPELAGAPDDSLSI
jgi:hypothetical protein